MEEVIPTEAITFQISNMVNIFDSENGHVNLRVKFAIGALLSHLKEGNF